MFPHGILANVLGILSLALYWPEVTPFSTDMYADQDGSASKESQAIYDRRIQGLVSATSLLSSWGFLVAALCNEYAENNLQKIEASKEGFLPILRFLRQSLWASFSGRSTDRYFPSL